VIPSFHAVIEENKLFLNGKPIVYLGGKTSVVYDPLRGISLKFNPIVDGITLTQLHVVSIIGRTPRGISCTGREVTNSIEFNCRIQKGVVSDSWLVEGRCGTISVRKEVKGIVEGFTLLFKVIQEQQKK